ncbi:ERI1 exoribonuclease 2-like isoform X2 [Homarus americanus]|uniref:ERI1 exoribonuclease 2-like isoform X2 n=1 Tax=Homarus americanus TaxID=6706 RepID=UPI001C470BE2|nr:ERI1 exoribonuclease 2-like isoform X2 [Homarus americanus]
MYTESTLELGLVQKRQVKNVLLPTGNKTKQEFDYLVVLDFEATCWETGPRVGRQEIIEFPAVLLDLNSGKILSEFQQYVMPTDQPILSAFCKSLTGITQEQVEAGIPLGACLSLFSLWIHKLCEQYQMSFNISVPSSHVTFATWTDWDLGVCLHYECLRKHLRKPEFFNQWTDVKVTYKKFYQRSPKGLAGALQDLGIAFEGREHSGICDTRNTAALISRMLRDGCVITVTKTLSAKTTKVNTMRAAAEILLGQMKKIVFSRRKVEDNCDGNKLKRKLEGHLERDTKKDGDLNPSQVSCSTGGSECIETSGLRDGIIEQNIVPSERIGKAQISHSIDRVNFGLSCNYNVESEIHPLGSYEGHSLSINDNIKERQGLIKAKSQHSSSILSKPFKVPSLAICKKINVLQNESYSSGCTKDMPKLLNYPRINSFETKVIPTINVLADLTNMATKTNTSTGNRSLQSHQKLQLSHTRFYQDTTPNLRLFKKTPPLCSCGRRAKLLVVSKPGPNQGRNFFSCPQGKNGKATCCKYFKWEDHPYTKVRSCASKAYTPVTNLNRQFVADSLPHNVAKREDLVKEYQGPNSSEPFMKKQSHNMTVPHFVNYGLLHETVVEGPSTSFGPIPYEITPYR